MADVEEDFEAPLTRPHHYYFAHYALRLAVFRSPAAAQGILAGTGAMKFLTNLWHETSKAVPQEEFVQPEGLSVSTEQLGTNGMLCIVTLPAPRFLVEAHFVGIVFLPPTRRLLVFKSRPVRYFTLEKGWSESGADFTTLGEWTIEGSHWNYGDGPPASRAAFSDAVRAKLAQP